MSTLFSHQDPFPPHSDVDLEEQRQLMNELVGLESRPNEKGDYFVPALDEVTLDDPLERRSTPKIWERGTTHLLFIGGATGIAALLLMALYTNFVGNHPRAIQAEAPVTEDDLFKHPDDSEIGTWKTQAALSQQRTQLQSLLDSQQQNPAEPSASPEATASSDKSQTIAPQPQVPPRTRPAPRSANPVRQSLTPSVSHRPAFKPQPASLPISRSLPLPPPRPDSPPPAPKDALEQLQIAASAGIYTTNRSNPGTRPPAIAVAQEQQLQSQPRQPRATRSTTDSATVPITTQVRAQVLTSIAWTGTQTDQKFRVQLSEPMQAEDGSMVLPKGTLFLAQVYQANRAGYLDVRLISAQVNGQDILIPPDTFLVQKPNGEPLQASIKNSRSGGAGKALGLAVLSGVSNAANTVNAPTIVSSGGTSTVSNDDPDIGAAALEGFTGSLAKTGTAQFEQTLRTSDPGQPILLLKAGTKLQLFVNQPFSL